MTGFVGVKTSAMTVVTPSMIVVYVYGVGPPGVPVVASGWPTGPCWGGIVAWAGA